jgi:hypothetical protein
MGKVGNWIYTKRYTQRLGKLVKPGFENSSSFNLFCIVMNFVLQIYVLLFVKGFIICWLYLL